MALIPDEYMWTAGTVTGTPSVESPEDGHHVVVRFALAVDRKGGDVTEQPVEARGATARYLQQKNLRKGDFVTAAGIIRTDGTPDAAPYLLLRIVSTDTSENA